jgi:hypothetical protein
MEFEALARAHISASALFGGLIPWPFYLQPCNLRFAVCLLGRRGCGEGGQTQEPGAAPCALSIKEKRARGDEEGDFS